MYRSRSKGASPLVNIPDGAQRRTSLHYACCDGNKECMEQLLLAGADLDARYCSLMICKIVDRLAQWQMHLGQRGL